jgi:threonine/homoserine/homoserine lactone efflux protein
MDLGHWVSLFSICLLGAMSPGPSLAVVMKSTIGGGRPAGYAAALAHGAGVGLYGLMTVAGLAVIITRSPTLFLVLQVLGALYLIYLGQRSLRSHGADRLPNDGTFPQGSPALDGFLVAFLNPKLAVFMLALFSQFLRDDFSAWEKGVMVATVGITDAAWYALVATLLARPAFLDKLRRSARGIDRVFGLILLGLALTVLASALR